MRVPTGAADAWASPSVAMLRSRTVRRQWSGSLRVTLLVILMNRAIAPFQRLLAAQPTLQPAALTPGCAIVGRIRGPAVVAGGV